MTIFGAFCTNLNNYLGRGGEKGKSEISRYNALHCKAFPQGSAFVYSLKAEPLVMASQPETGNQYLAQHF